MRTVFTGVLMALLFSCLPAQELKKNSLSANALGTTALAGVSYERLIANRISLEAGVGLVGIGGGLSYYPFKAQYGKICPYSGLKYTFMALVDVFAGGVFYIPMGATWFSPYQFNIGIDIGPAFGNGEFMDMEHDPADFDPEASEGISVWGNVKLGIRF